MNDIIVIDSEHLDEDKCEEEFPKDDIRVPDSEQTQEC